MRIERSSLAVIAAVVLAAAALTLLPRRDPAGSGAPVAAPAAAPAAPAKVVALYDGAASAGSLGVHVADVGVDARGASLTAAGDPEIADRIGKALAELRARPSLPLAAEAEEGASTVMTAREIKPGEPMYAWAVGAFLRGKTGLRYDVR